MILIRFLRKSNPFHRLLKFTAVKTSNPVLSDKIRSIKCCQAGLSYMHCFLRDHSEKVSAKPANNMAVGYLS